MKSKNQTTIQIPVRYNRKTTNCMQINVKMQTFVEQEIIKKPGIMPNSNCPLHDDDSPPPQKTRNTKLRKNFNEQTNNKSEKSWR